MNERLKTKSYDNHEILNNLKNKLDKLFVESNGIESADIIESQIGSMFGKSKEFVLNRNLPECKKSISDYIKEIVVYKDHIDGIFRVVFSFVDNEITNVLHITTSKKQDK